MVEDTKPNHFRTFYILIITQMFSFMGSRISSLAVGIWIFNETGNATPLVMVSFFTALPAVLAGSISGVLADRWDRRWVMALADAGQAVGTILLLISFSTDGFQLWHLYGVVVIQAIFGVFQNPAFTASITMLIPSDKRVRANAVRQLTGPIAAIIAPIIATSVFTAVGVEGAIIVDLLTFFIAVIVVMNVDIPRPASTAIGRSMQGSIWKETWGGLTYLWAHRPLLILMGYYAIINFLVSGATILTVPYLIARIGDTQTMGTALGVINMGGIGGILIIAYWGGVKRHTSLILVATAVSAIFLALSGIAQTPLALMITQFLTLLPIPIGNAIFISTLQAKVPPDVQGRVFAVMGQIVRLLLPVAYLLAGPLADNVLEPMVGTARWEPFASLFGNSEGAGMGMIYTINGILLILVTLGLSMIASIRNIDTDFPDYVPEVAIEPPSIKPVPPKDNKDDDTEEESQPILVQM